MHEDLLTFKNDSWISEVQYNPKTEAMNVIINGSDYECQGVSLGVFQEFQRAESKGKYFNKYIKDQYSHRYFE